MVRTKEETKIFMETLCAEFSAVVQDAIDQGISDDFADHLEFMERAFEIFMDFQQGDK